MRPLLLAVFLSGCVPAPKVLHYSDFDLVIAPQADVDRFCGYGTGHWDDGTRRMRGQHIAGCYSALGNEIWLVDDCQGAKALPHELAHMDGVADPDHEGYDW